MKRLFLILSFLIVTIGIATAQEEATQQRDIYREAEELYLIGRLEEAQQLLTDNMGSFNTQTRESVYRLLTLCSIGLDNEEQAGKYVHRLLEENPYYTTTLQDPQRFIDMVNEIKSGTSSVITTASSQAETLYEAPVPITLITDEMIQNCGGRNIKEILMAYVPGMNNLDCNDDINMSMRGVFNTGQEKILIMLDGHRLNNYSTNIASPDFSISLSKIKQIEVLRGPASSLYGGVALTAVVNIITKQGADVDGARIKAGVGNYGQLRGDIIFGKRYFDVDVMVWGSIYKADGQEVYVNQESTGARLNSGNVTIGGIGESPTYDLGFKLKWQRFTLLYNTHFSQVESPFTMSYLSSTYTRSKYATFNGISPSFATRAHHLTLSISEQINSNLHVNGGISYDNSDLTHYQIISETAINKNVLKNVMPAFYELFEGIIDLIDLKGMYRYINGQEVNYSAYAHGDYTYMNTAEHTGLINFGAQFDHFQLKDVRYCLGLNFNTNIENENIPALGKGHENSFNVFMQLKHRWKSFILNAGLRYDYKRHFDNKDINEFSPRIALILLQPKWSAKLSYSKSFVDAPYLYRKYDLFIPMLIGDESSSADAVSQLRPEYMHSFQLTLAGINWFKGFNIELNTFYNHAKDLIYSSTTSYSNAGTNKTIGTELTTRYDTKRLNTYLTVTWQHVMQAEIFNFNVNKAYNVPDVTINAVVAYKLLKDLKIHGHLTFEGKQTAFIVDLLEDRPRLLESEINPHAIFNMGANYNLKPFEFGFNVHNVFNTKIYRGGMGTSLVPQQGTWFLFSAAYKF